jgi:hypothetical protein
MSKYKVLRLLRIRRKKARLSSLWEGGKGSKDAKEERRAGMEDNQGAQEVLPPPLFGVIGGSYAANGNAAVPAATGASVEGKSCQGGALHCRRDPSQSEGVCLQINNTL